MLLVISFVTTIHHDTYPAIDPLKADLSGKHVLITGASKGIGRATALSFAKAGASGIAILARSDLSSLVTELHAVAAKAGRPRPKVLSLTADQTDQSQVEAAAAKISAEFGRLDVLINNAGYLETWKPIAESDVQDWWKTFEVNVKGVYLMDRALIPLMLKGGDKTIIVVTSMGAHVVAPGASAYQTTKQAVIRLNNFLVAEYGEQGLLAYSVHPGGVATELAKTMPKYMYKVLQDTPELAGDTFVFLTREKRDWSVEVFHPIFIVERQILLANKIGAGFRLNDRFVSVNWDMEEFVAKKDQVVKDDLLRYRLQI